jgi:N-acetylglutamate synthase-like GNAT family acetyltransferase
LSHIRAATAEDAPLLSELSVRSKAHWGYDAAFIEACREDLRVSAEDISTSIVRVHEDAGQINGYYQLRPGDGHMELVSLFVDPRMIGTGTGKQLWLHAVATTRDLGIDDLQFQSDPHAVGFYLAMGAVRIGTSPSTVDLGRLLPLMRFPLRTNPVNG